MKRALLLILAGGCAGEPTIEGPVWALDTLHLEPVGDDLEGLQVWALHTDPWSRSKAARHYVCGVVVELEGAATEPCPRCDLSWVITSTVGSTDCDDGFDLTSLPVVTALGIGAVAQGLEGDDPRPGESAGTWVEVGGRWLAHGWAWPADPDGDAAWGADPFEAWSAFAWDLLGR